MCVKKDILLDKNYYSFYETLRLLRVQHKGKYISNLFCTKLENFSNEIEKIIAGTNYVGRVMKMSHALSPEKISDDMVGLCIECVEVYLQKISTGPLIAEPQTIYAEETASDKDDSTLQILTHIVCDLRSLATYIKYTLYSNALALHEGKSSSRRKLKKEMLQ